MTKDSISLKSKSVQFFFQRLGILVISVHNFYLFPIFHLSLNPYSFFFQRLGILVISVHNFYLFPNPYITNSISSKFLRLYESIPSKFLRLYESIPSKF